MMKHQRRHTVDLSGAGLLPSKVSMSIQRCSSHWHTGHPTAIGKPKRAASGLDCGQQCSAKKCKLSNRSMPAAPLVSVSASAAETLPDRAYQTFCVKEALCHNVIACLPTGSGKTRIALRVAQALLPPLGDDTPVHVFITPTVPLCIQQAEVMAAEGLRVALLCGGTASTVKGPATQGGDTATAGAGEPPPAQAAAAPGSNQSTEQDPSPQPKLSVGQHQLQLAAQGKRLRLDAGSRARWRRLVFDHHVIVATPGELLHGLVQGVISARDLSLVVFDEVHHADAQHTYARILRNFLLATPAGHKQLPGKFVASDASIRTSCRLLGLTASPYQLLSKEAQGGERPCSLEDLMRGHIVTAPDMNELRAAVPTAALHMLPYSASPPPRRLATLVADLATAAATLRDVAQYRKVRLELGKQEALLRQWHEQRQQQVLGQNSQQVAPANGTSIGGHEGGAAAPPLAQGPGTSNESTDQEAWQMLLTGVLEDASSPALFTNMASQVDDIMYVASKLGLYAALTVAQHGLLSARDKTYDDAAEYLYDNDEGEEGDWAAEVASAAEQDAGPDPAAAEQGPAADQTPSAATPTGVGALPSSTSSVDGSQPWVLKSSDLRLGGRSGAGQASRHTPPPAGGVAGHTPPKHPLPSANGQPAAAGGSAADNEDSVSEAGSAATASAASDTTWSTTPSSQGPIHCLPAFNAHGTVNTTQALRRKQEQKKLLERQLRQSPGLIKEERKMSGTELENAAAARALAVVLSALLDAVLDEEGEDEGAWDSDEAVDVKMDLIGDIDEVIETKGHEGVLEGDLAHVAGKLLEWCPGPSLERALHDLLEAQARQHGLAGALPEAGGSISTGASQGARRVAADVWARPQLCTLVGYLLHGLRGGRGPPASLGTAMVFVTRKAEAVALHSVLSSLPSVQAAGIRPSCFIGKGGTRSVSMPLGMSMAAQRETMALFRGGTDVNLLLATYVGAEGLDFGDCGAVVLLEPAAHLVDYVQCKGRVRKAGGECVFLMEYGCIDHERRLERLTREHQTMLASIKRRHELYISKYCTTPCTVSPSPGSKRGREALEDDDDHQAGSQRARSPGGTPSPQGASNSERDVSKVSPGPGVEPEYEVTGGAADELDPEAQAELVAAAKQAFSNGGSSWLAGIPIPPVLPQTPGGQQRGREAGGLSDDEVEDLPEEELMYRTSAGALCPADSAQGVVERFCTSLPGHSSFTHLRPDIVHREYGGRFRAALFLPPNVLLPGSRGQPSQQFAVVGAIASSKRRAIQSACLRTVRLLHSVLKLLDDHLNPSGVENALLAGGQPEHFMLAEKMVKQGLTGYIPRLTLEHRLPKCLMPPPAPQPAADTQAEVQAAAPAIMTEQPEIVFQTQPPADQATCTAVRQRVSGPQAGSTAAADGSVLMAQSTNTEQASPTEQAPPHVLHLYAWLMRPCPSPLPHQLDPLGSTIYDRDHARDLFERSWAWAESKGLCSHSAHAGGDSSRTSSEARKVERDSAEVAAAMGGITAHVSAAGSAAAGGGEAPDAAPSSNERTATSSKSRLQWLHPFGVLLHQKLPEGGTLPSSVWMDRGVHALAYPLYLGPQTLTPAEYEALGVAHAALLAATAPPKQPAGPGSEAERADKARRLAEEREAAAERQRQKAAAKVQCRSNRLRLIQLRARKGNKAGPGATYASQGVEQEVVSSSSSEQSEGSVVAEDDAHHMDDVAGMEEDTTLVLPSEEQDQLVQAVEQGMDLDSSTGTSGGAVAAGVAGSSTATSPGSRGYPHRHSGSQGPVNLGDGAVRGGIRDPDAWIASRARAWNDSNGFTALRAALAAAGRLPDQLHKPGSSLKDGLKERETSFTAAWAKPQDRWFLAVPVSCLALAGLSILDDCSGVLPGAVHWDLLAQLSSGAVPVGEVVNLHGFTWQPPPSTADSNDRPHVTPDGQQQAMQTGRQQHQEVASMGSPASATPAIPPAPVIAAADGAAVVGGPSPSPQPSHSLITPRDPVTASQALSVLEGRVLTPATRLTLRYVCTGVAMRAGSQSGQPAQPADEAVKENMQSLQPPHVPGLTPATLDTPANQVLHHQWQKRGKHVHRDLRSKSSDETTRETLQRAYPWLPLAHVPGDSPLLSGTLGTRRHIRLNLLMPPAAPKHRIESHDHWQKQAHQRPLASGEPADHSHQPSPQAKQPPTEQQAVQRHEHECGTHVGPSVQQQQQQQALPAPRLQPLATEQGADVTGQLAKAMSQQVGDQGLLLPCMSLLHPVPLPLWSALHCLPSLVRRLEATLAAEELRGALRDTCGPDVPVPHVPLLRTALTPAAACEPWNLELAELLGDAVLDHLAACYMYDFVKGLHEKLMTECKIRLVANEILLRYALPPREQAVQQELLKQAQAIAQNGEGTVKVAEVRDSQGSGDDQDKEPPVPVLPYMRSYTLHALHLLGPGSLIDPDLAGRIKYNVRGKRGADCIEAVIGAAFLDAGGAAALRLHSPPDFLAATGGGGNQGTNLVQGTAAAANTSGPGWDGPRMHSALLNTAKFLQSTGILPLNAHEVLSRMYSPPAPPAAPPSSRTAAKLAADHAAMAKQVAPILGGYMFRQPALLVEALTHCTWHRASATPCNQRLEFLGDSALDMITIAYLITSIWSARSRLSSLGSLCPADLGTTQQAASTSSQQTGSGTVAGGDGGVQEADSQEGAPAQRCLQGDDGKIHKRSGRGGEVWAPSLARELRAKLSAARSAAAASGEDFDEEAAAAEDPFLSQLADRKRRWWGLVLDPALVDEPRKHIVSNAHLAEMCARSGLHTFLRSHLKALRSVKDDYVRRTLEQEPASWIPAAIAAAAAGDGENTKALTAMKMVRDNQRMQQQQQEGGSATPAYPATANDQAGPEELAGAAGRTAAAAAAAVPGRQAASRPAAAPVLKGGRASMFAKSDSPKFLADQVEAVLGAVLVDSGGDLGAVWGVFWGIAKAAGMEKGILEAAMIDISVARAARAMVQRRNAAQAAGRRELQRRKKEAVRAAKEGLRAAGSPEQQQGAGQSAAVADGLGVIHE